MSRLLIIILFLPISVSFAQNFSYCELANDIVSTAEKFHYNPRQNNDDFSKRVFDGIFKELDPSHSYFTLADFNQFEIDTAALDEAIKNKNCEFLFSLTSKYEENIDRILTLLDKIKPSDLVFSSKKSIDFTTYSKENNLETRWKSILALELLSDYFDQNSQELTKANYSQFIESNLLKYSTQIKCFIESKFNKQANLADYVGEKYLNAIAHAYDPHTVYFNPKERDKFEEQLSKNSLSFGLKFYKNEKGIFEVVEIIPGGSAWSSNQINEGDLLLSITTDQSETIEVECLSSASLTNEINQFDIASFEFKKLNGSIVKLTLEKKEIEVQDNVIESFVLEDKHKIGYLYLPSFYTAETTSHHLPNGCANDIAKELVKLKSDKIEGLIIDLRDNGGGSMLEAIRLVGIFINYGAITIIDSRNEDPISLKDLDRGMIYTKPIAVLVNQFSASASELFAAAMQDYNRAIIVGNNTFGKATSQKIIPVDAFRYTTDNQVGDLESDKGYLKITNGKFYRLDGSSHQKVGIQVDIAIDFDNESNYYSEASMPNALQSTRVEKKTYYTPFDTLPIASLKKQSISRLAPYQKKKSPIKRNKNYPLDFISFKSFYADIDQASINLDSNLTSSVYSVKSSRNYLSYDSATETEKEMEQRIINSLKKDPYVIETYHIINDLINYQH